MNTGPITIGTDPYDEFWDGLLDDVRLYNIVLPASEIANLAASGGGGGPGPSVCNGTYRDEFNAIALDGSDGTFDWSLTPWEEIGETDGINKKDVRILNDTSNYQLQIKDNNNGGEGMQRALNLEGAINASLSFIYRRKRLDNSDDYVSVLISTTGSAGPWSELDKIGTNNDSVYQPYSRDITSYSSANTVIRLLSSPNLGDKDIVYFDDFQVECSP